MESGCGETGTERKKSPHFPLGSPAFRSVLGALGSKYGFFFFFEPFEF